MENTKIEWCNTIGPDGKSYPGMTFNPWWGCQKVSPACKNCYAATFANRYHPGLWGPAATTPRKIASESYWQQPLKWNAKAAKLNVRLKVFCASMSDVFEDHPGVGESRKRLFKLIEETPKLDWLLLTKRPENIMKMVPYDWIYYFPRNIWMGTTVENQRYANERIPQLLKVPAKVRFLSMEPLSGPVKLNQLIREEDGYAWVDDCLTGFKAHGAGGWLGPKIDWVIAGGESGQQANPSHPDWFRSLRDQCNNAGVPFFFKQWGEYYTRWIDMSEQKPVFKFYDSYLQFTQKLWVNKGDKCIDAAGKICSIGGDFKTAKYPVAITNKVGKKAAGRLLDGIEHNGMPLLNL